MLVGSWVPVRAAVAAPSEAQPCAPPAGGPAATIPGAEAVRLECGQALACWLPRLAAARAATRGEGADLLTLWAYQDLVHGAPFALRSGAEADLAAGLRRRALGDPDDAGWAFLVARAVGDRAAKLAGLRQVAAAHPSFPPVDLELAKLEAAAGDAAGAQASRKHLVRFLAACPGARADVLELLQQVGDGELWQRFGPPLRRAAERQLVASGDYRPFPPLWRNEFHFTPVSGHEALRGRVKADVERLRAVIHPDDLEAWYALDEGFQILGDTAGREWVDDQVLAHLPCALPTPAIRRDRFDRDLPRPEAGDEAAERSYQRALYVATTEWTTTCPGDARSWALRLGAIRRLHALGEPVPQSEVEATAAAILAHLAAETMTTPTFPSLPAEITETWLELGVHLESVPDLVARDLAAVAEDAAIQRAWAAERENPTAEGEASLALRDRRQRLANRDLAARGFLALGRLSDARAAMAEAEVLLASLGELGEGRAAVVHRELAARLSRRRAELAEREGGQADAMALYRAAAATDPAADSDARRLWTALGGTAEGWAALAAAEPAEADGSASAADWQAAKVGEALPPLEGFDLTGKRWRSADLPGRAVFVNLWATWCPPCRKELPQIELLHRRFAGSDAVLVVTLNVDANPGLVQPFLEHEGWGFPVVLVGEHYAGHDMGVGIPRSWILDRTGRAVWTEVGFKDDPEWLERTRARLEAVAAGSLEPGTMP